MTLPPGQQVIDRFPRFGADLRRPPPAVPPDPVVEVRGDALAAPVTVPVAGLAGQDRRDLRADFHCVSGWTARDVRWQGVSFAAFYRATVEPSLRPGVAVTHLRLRGADGVAAVLLLEDATADDVLLADHLDGRPLDGDHGAPVRLVSPAQYGYKSIKHLCRIDVLTQAPPGPRPSLLEGLLVRHHPRARVSEEERNGVLPNVVVRPLYRVLRGAMLSVSDRAARRT